MNQKHILVSLLLSVLMLIPIACLAEGTTHYFLDIPAQELTPSIVEQALQDKYGEVIAGEYKDYLIEDLGYTFSMWVNYNDEAQVGAERIFMSKNESGWGLADEFEAIIIRDIEQFIVMEQELIAQYGEPTHRYFFIDTTKYNLSGFTPFMFPQSQWNAEQMLAVCKSEKLFVAFTHWDNVTIRLWVDWKNEKKFGFLSQLDWYYVYKDVTNGMQNAIVNYPPE